MTINNPPSPDPSPDLFARFRQLLHAGNYDALVGRGLRRTLRAAATDRSLEPEIGALRLALTRLINEERDPARLAAGIARLTSVAIQAARFRASADDPDNNRFRNTLLRELELYEQELASQSLEPPPFEEELVSQFPEPLPFASD